MESICAWRVACVRSATILRGVRVRRILCAAWARRDLGSRATHTIEAELFLASSPAPRLSAAWRHTRSQNACSFSMIASLLSLALAQPNFVLHFIDDTGFGDYGFNVQTDDTPRLTAAARRGMVLGDFHAAASVCTPSRAGLLTGRLGLRTGVTHNFGPPSLHGLALNETTIAELLSANGYRTAMAGKWHLGHRPPHSPPCSRTTRRACSRAPGAETRPSCLLLRRRRWHRPRRRPHRFRRRRRRRARRSPSASVPRA